MTEIRISPWAPGLRALLGQLLGDPVMTEFLGGPESDDKLDDRQSRYEVPGSRQYVVLVDGQPSGHVGYWPREWQDVAVWETGWAVLPSLQGRGVATNAMLALLDVIRGDDATKPVHAFPSVENAASNALCRKLGFELLGAFDFEYPPGHPLRCNDWVMDLQREGRQTTSG